MIKQLPNGKWWLYMLDEFGEKVRMTFDRKSDAVAKEAQITQRKYDAKLSKAELRKSRYTFDKAIKDFEFSKVNLRKNSVKRYRPIITQFKYFVEAIGLKYVDEFTSDHATLLFNELSKEKIDPKGNSDKMVKPKPKTVNLFIQLIKAFFRDEMVKRHIQYNPMIHIKNLKIDKKKTAEYYTEDELRSFFKQSMPEAYRNVFLGLLYTGMRFGELSNLTWKDVDFKRKLIHIRSSEKFQTKTVNSERSIPMTKELYKLLAEMKAESESEYVFASTQGFQVRERRALQICKKVAENAKIKSNAYLHKFRHTYATILVQKGERLEDIKELLGHSTITETEIYAHHRSDQLHDRVIHLDNIFSKKKGQSK